MNYRRCFCTSPQVQLEKNYNSHKKKLASVYLFLKYNFMKHLIATVLE